MQRGSRGTAADDGHLYICGHDMMQATGVSLEETGYSIIFKGLACTTAA